MKRFFTLLSIFIVTIILSCDYHLLNEEDTNPFEAHNVELTVTRPLNPNETNKITFVWMTDNHVGRETHESGITRYETQFIKWLDDNHKSYPFILCTGDLTDSGKTEDWKNSTAFVESIKAYDNDNFIYVIGNHEIHNGSTQDDWLKYFTSTNPINQRPFLEGRYTYNGLSIYIMDNDSRAFRSSTLDYFDSTTKADTNPFKIAAAHVPLTGQTTQATGMQFVVAEDAQRNFMLRAMDEGNVGVYFCGHHHIGNYEEHYTATTGEMMGAAFHRKDLYGLESDGYWYECTLDKTTKVLTVDQYYAETATYEKSFSFPMP